MDSRLARECLPAANRDVHVMRIEFDGAADPTGLFRRQQGRAATDERIEDNTVPSGAILDGIDDHCQRLYGRMRLQLLHPAAAEGVHSGIDPDVGSVPAALTKTEIIDVLARADLEDEHQLVLGPIERAHASIRFGPDA